MMHFPYVHTPCDNLRPHESIRPEGTDLSQYWIRFWRGLSYLRKYYSKNDRAPIEMHTHFDHQRRLLSELRLETEVTETKLGLFGDLMWIRDAWDTFLPPESHAILASHDALLGNLETIISPRIRVTDRLPDLLRYSSPPEYLRSFRRADGNSLLSALSTANNHTLDFGDAGALDTLDALDAEGISHSGVQRTPDSPRWVEVPAGEFRVGFVAATYGVNRSQDFAASKLALHTIPGLAPETADEPNIDTIRADLQAMKIAGIDFRVVSVHWGFEYESYPTVRMMQTARELVAAGADLVMGHHPHIQQPLEVLYVDQKVPKPYLNQSVTVTSHESQKRARRALVAYSLGNFATTMFTDRCRLAVLLSLGLKRNSEGFVDWIAPKTQWFYNVAPTVARGGPRRKLVPWPTPDPKTRNQLGPIVTKTAQHVDGSTP